MGNIDIVLDKLVCHAMTEWFHDEVYYMATITHLGAEGGTSIGVAPVIGPVAAQGATSDRGDTPLGAWETDDGDEGALALGASLLQVTVEDRQRVVVTLTMMESDGDNYADIETRAATVAEAVLGTVSVAFPPSAAVAVPVGAALAVLTAVGQSLKDYLANHDDVLGSVTLTLEGVGSDVHVVDVGVSGEVTQQAADGQDASLTGRLKGGGGDYEVSVSVRGATMSPSQARTEGNVRDHRGSGGVVVPSQGAVQGAGQGTVRDHRAGTAATVVRDHR
jgi:hypothetical protein